MNRDKFFLNDYSRVFTVKLAWHIAQPFVCGELKEIVEYALKPNNGIEYFAEVTNAGFKKVSKKDLKALLSRNEDLQALSKQLFAKY